MVSCGRQDMEVRAAERRGKGTQLETRQRSGCGALLVKKKTTKAVTSKTWKAEESLRGTDSFLQSSLVRRKSGARADAELRLRSCPELRGRPAVALAPAVPACFAVVGAFLPFALALVDCGAVLLTAAVESTGSNCLSCGLHILTSVELWREDLLDRPCSVCLHRCFSASILSFKPLVLGQAGQASTAGNVATTQAWPTGNLVAS